MDNLSRFRVQWRHAGDAFAFSRRGSVCAIPVRCACGRRMCREMEFSNGGKQLLTFFLLFCASDSFDFWRDVWFKILCGYE